LNPQQKWPIAADGGDIPRLLCISGHDPSGGAGIQADIEVCAAHGVRAVSLLSCLTAQDTRNVIRVFSTPVAQLQAMARCLLDDIQVDAVKVGLLGDAAQIPWLLDLLLSIKKPVVLDPILRAGGGKLLVADAAVVEMQRQLFAVVSVLTPNAAEARQLTGCGSVIEAGAQLLESGAQAVLVTGGDEDSISVVNSWFQTGAQPEHFEFARIPHRFHGAGCTLSAAIAAQLALGRSPRDAVVRAQQFAHAALVAADAPGAGRKLPRRFGLGEVATLAPASC
jgi:hydroxymethylpyrimidine/phosphomethylpyrimidine kinase